MPAPGPLPDLHVFVYGSREEAEAIAAAIANVVRARPTAGDKPILILLSPHREATGTLYLSPEALEIARQLGFSFPAAVMMRVEQLPAGISLFFGQMGRSAGSP